MRLRLLLVAIAPLALACGGSDSPERATVSERVPLVGIPHERPARLVRLHARSLRPASRAIRLRGRQWGTDFSPDGRHLALGVGGHGRIQIVDLRRWRTHAVIRAARRGAFSVVAWVAPRRIVAFRYGARHEVVALDPFDGRVAWRVPIAAEPAGEVVPTRDGLALLAVPRGRIGPARLLRVDGEGHVHETPLPEITGGTEAPTGRDAVARQRLPGLAVDLARNRAYVVAAERAAVPEVDLASGAAAMHPLSVRRTALRRVEDLLVGTAEAKGVSGPARWLCVLGSGLLAVTGADHDDGLRRPHRLGLWIVDPGDWSWRRADERVDSAVPAAGGLLAFDHRGGGIARFGPDGRPLWRRRGGSDAQAHGAFVYARDRRRHRTAVLDVRDGRELATLATALPPFIVPDA